MKKSRALVLFFVVMLAHSQCASTIEIDDQSVVVEAVLHRKIRIVGSITGKGEIPL